VAKNDKTVKELTAAGQLRICTVFPFNPETLHNGNQKQGKGKLNCCIVKIVFIVETL